MASVLMEVARASPEKRSQNNYPKNRPQGELYMSGRAVEGHG